MKNLINHIRTNGIKNVMVVGDVMLDEYFFGSVSRISPEAPVPVLKEEYQEWSLGGAANVAANCRHIGCDVTIVGIIGDHDVYGDRFLSMLREINISTDGIVRSAHRLTTTKKRFLVKSHQLLRMDAESGHALSIDESNELIKRVDSLMIPDSIVLLSDYAKGVLTKEFIEYICTRARERNCIILVDPKGPDFSKYRGVDYIKPNNKEFKQMVEFFNLQHHHSLEDNARKICSLLGIKGLVITQGEAGISYISREQTIHSPAYKREVYDLTGAGDTVFAFLAIGLANKLSVENCLMLANHAASVAVSHVKTYAVSLDELIDRSMEPTEKIYTDWADLKIELDWLRADGKKVVFTNGCFDIIHPGHIHTLKEAKKYGDILVVAINTDDSVRRYKGATRPINNFSHRATIISAIGFVDFVVSFEQDTPRALIEYLKPDVLVKGGDYQKEKVAGYDVVTSYGGEVHIVDYMHGLSTTTLIKKISSSQLTGL